MEHESVRWHPRVTVSKYSAGQAAYARNRGEVPWSHRLALTRRDVLNGNLLRLLFREPEDGIVFDEGNGVTTAGLANLAAVLTGGGHPLAPGHMVLGVGSDDTPFNPEQVRLSAALGEEPGRSWYKPMDAGYPRPAGGSVIEGQATFTEAEACFGWHEWCWGTGPAVEPEPHHSLRGAYGGAVPVMVNRRAHPAGYGVKEPGVAWVFRAEILLRG